MRALSLLLPLALGSCAAVSAPPSAQDSLLPEETRWGVEAQLYPAGLIVGPHFERPLSDRDVLTTRVAANLTERQDFGEHDDESGVGFGGGAGWRRFAKHGYQGWFWGGRIDLWFLSIDWEDRRGGMDVEGETDIVVVQPTAELGYGWAQEGGGRWDLSASLGAEINVDTDGEDVGEGAILLLGVTWTR